MTFLREKDMRIARRTRLPPVFGMGEFWQIQFCLGVVGAVFLIMYPSLAQIVCESVFGNSVVFPGVA